MASRYAASYRPKSSTGYFCSTSGGSPRFREQARWHARTPASADEYIVGDEDIFDKVDDLTGGVEGVHGCLGDIGDLFPQDRFPNIIGLHSGYIAARR